MSFLRKLPGYDAIGIDKAGLDLYIREYPAPPLCSPCSKRERLIVSLTTFPARCSEIRYALYSIFRQTLLPDMVVLYLSEDEFPNGEKDLPDTLLDWRKRGLVIRMVKNNLKSYNKLIHALKDFPEDIIVTVDDDIFYHPDWLKKLYNTYLDAGRPKTVFASRTHFVQTSQNTILSYSRWLHETGLPVASYRNFPTGVGGTLFPPGSLDPEVMNMDTAQKLCPYADDIWFYVMTVKNKSGVVFAKDAAYKLIYTDLERELHLSGKPTLASQNVFQGGNDIQLRNVLAYYPEVPDLILHETPK